MRSTTQVLLVRDRRTGMHALVRPVVPWTIGRLSHAASPEQYNALIMARTPSTLVEAADACGPLRRVRDDMERPEAPLLLDAADLREFVADGVLEEASAAALIDECLLEPFARMGADDAFIRDGRKPSGDARRIVSERGFSRADDVLGPVDDDPFLYEIEPLQDWVFARNLISIAARLAGIQRLADDLEPGRGTLERAGFREVTGTSLVSRLEGAPTAAWVIPILHAPKLGEDGSRAPSLLANPLLGQLTETGALELGDVAIPMLKGAPEVAFLSVWDVDGGAVEPGEDRWLYLALVGDDQGALTDVYVKALHRLFRNSEVSVASYESDGLPMGYPDAPSALWAALTSHERHYLMTCKQCGRSILATHQGPPREFCSDACRAVNKRGTRPPFLW